MTVIESGQGVITQINVFDVDPDKVDLLVDTLQEAARTVTHIPGWMSANQQNRHRTPTNGQVSRLPHIAAVHR